METLEQIKEEIVKLNKQIHQIKIDRDNDPYLDEARERVREISESYEEMLKFHEEKLEHLLLLLFEKEGV